MEKLTVAENGIKIYSYKNTSVHSFFISLFVKSGVMYEAADENGITHFLEHVLIRNINKLMDGKMYATLDKYGIEYNASTYGEMVQFYLSGAKHNFPIAIDFITKLFCPISLDKTEIDSERGRIKAEIRESNDKTALSTFTNELVWTDTSLSRSIVGRAGSLNKIGLYRLEEYRKRVFSKDNIFFYISGNFQDEDVLKLKSRVEAYEVSSIISNSNIAPVPNDFGNRSGEIYIKNERFCEARFTFDVDLSKLSVPTLDLLYDTLLTGYNSKFFIELSEKRGLLYDTVGAVDRYKNIGTLYFSFEVKEKDIYEAFEVIVSVLNSLKEKALSDEECMKSAYTDNAYMLLDDPRDLNFTFAYDNHIMGLGYASIEDRIKAYGAVSAQDILNAAREIFKSKNLIVTMKANKRKIDKARLEKILAGLG
jgi:predicted Zn-dependent peptidase